jgi:hypothetical protein
MFATLTTSMVVMSCLGCAGQKANDSDIIRINLEPASADRPFAQSDAFDDPFEGFAAAGFRLPPADDGASLRTWSPRDTEARFRAMDLATPSPIRFEQDPALSAEVTFAASSLQTGLGFDFQVSPRALIQRSRSGENIANMGGEIRIGQGLADRDLRATHTKAPSWYFFVGTDNEALIWNFADKQSLGGVALRDQATVGDLQAGLAWSIGSFGQTSFGLVERKLSYSDIAGDHDVSTRERFAALSVTFQK